jgi:asparagine synthase (glutamine-hydrolysing)
MSGGLDSTSVAAVAATVNNNENTVTAHTATCHDAIEGDEEGFYAGLVTSHLKISGFSQAIEDYDLYQKFESPEMRLAEPLSNPNLYAHYEKLEKIKNTGARIMLTGQGGDAPFSRSGLYYKNLLYAGKFLKLAKETRNHFKLTRTLRGMGLRSVFMPFQKKEGFVDKPLPYWISTEFARRNDLENRWNAWWDEWNSRTDAHAQLGCSWLSHILASYEELKMPIVVRHPFYDVRLINFLLGLPNYITNKKYVLREAMNGILPNAVVTRPKTVPDGDVLRIKLSLYSNQIRIRSALDKVGDTYINKSKHNAAFNKYLEGEGMESTWSSGIIIAPAALNYWLKYSYISE